MSCSFPYKITSKCFERHDFSSIWKQIAMCLETEVITSFSPPGMCAPDFTRLSAGARPRGSLDICISHPFPLEVPKIVGHLWLTMN